MGSSTQQACSACFDALLSPLPCGFGQCDIISITREHRIACGTERNSGGTTPPSYQQPSGVWARIPTSPLWGRCERPDHAVGLRGFRSNPTAGAKASGASDGRIRADGRSRARLPSRLPSGRFGSDLRIAVRAAWLPESRSPPGTHCSPSPDPRAGSADRSRVSLAPLPKARPEVQTPECASTRTGGVAVPSSFLHTLSEGRGAHAEPIKSDREP